MVYSDIASGLGLQQPRPATDSRERLLRAIDDAATAALTIIRGPGGSGKTALLSEWASSRQGHCAWVSLGRLAADGQCSARQLTSWMLAALASAAPPAEVATYDQAAAAVAAGLSLAQSFPPGAGGRCPARLLIIDDLHLVPATQLQPVLDILRAMPGLRIIAATRSLEPLEHGRAFLDFETAVIGPDDLALTEVEAAALLEGTPLARHARAVLAAAGGSVRWVRYLAIKAQDMAGAFPGLGPFIRAAARDVSRRLLPTDAPATLRRFLLAIAVPESTPAGLAAALCPGAPTEDLLHRAELDGLLTRGADGRATLVPLLRTCLLAVLAQEQPEHQRRLEQACAEWFLGSGYPLEALRHAVNADDLEMVTRVLRVHGVQLLMNLPHATRRILEQLPRPRLGRAPAPALALGILYSADPLRRSQGLKLCAAAVGAAQRFHDSVPPPSAAERFLLASVEAVGLRLRGGLGRAARRARDGLSIYLQMPASEQEHIGPLEVPAVAQLGVTLARAGEHQAAADAFRLATAQAAARRLPEQGYYSALTAWALVSTGDAPSARNHLADSRRHSWSGAEAGPYAATPIQLAETRLALERLDLGAARTALSPLLPGADASEFWPYIRRYEALLELLEGKAPAALTQVQSFEARRRYLPPIGRWEQLALDRMRSLLLLAVGQPAQALKHLGRPSPVDVHAALLTARIRLACAEPQTALSILAGMDEDHAGPAVQAEISALSAGARLQLGEAAGLELAHLASLQERFGLGLSTALLPAPDLARLASACSASGIRLRTLPASAVIPGCKPLAVLTPREEAVLQALASTASIAEIAAIGFVSVNTVKSQLRSVYRKLEVANREQALEEARNRGLI